MSDEEQRDAVLRKVPQEREAWDYEAQGPPLSIDIDTLEQVLGTLDVTKSPGSAGMTNTFLKAMTFQYHGERARQTTRELCRFLTAVANRKMPRWYYVAWTACLLYTSPSPRDS